MAKKPSKMPDYIARNPKNRKEAGKGDVQRPVDNEKFRKNWDDIFKKKKD